MAVIGLLGDVLFQVDEQTVRTLRNFEWSGEANWATHMRQGGNALTEYTGRGVEKVTFEVQLNRELGVEPLEEIAKFFGYERNGVALALTIGSHAYGRYRWIIKDHTTSAEIWDQNGDMAAATVKLTLWEYLKK